MLSASNTRHPEHSRASFARLDINLPLGLCDTTTEARCNRVKIKRYDAEFPESDNPEHTLWPRESRNSSPTHKKDAGLLNAFLEYFELNKSFESLQSNFLKADNDNFGDPEWEEGDLKKPLRDPEAELETRPNYAELVACYDVPTVQYETRQVGLITGPKLGDCGYCMFPTSPLIHVMKIPVSGDVWCIGFNKDKLLEHDASARNALPTRGIRRTQNRINDYADRIEKPELLNISDVAMHRKWTIHQVGGLRFAPYRMVSKTKISFKGTVTHYRANRRWRRAKEDKYGTPYGPQSKGSNPQFWKPLYPKKQKTKLVWLSPEEKAKQWANKAKPISCHMTADEALEAFRLKLLASGKPANDNQQYDGLPYDVESKDELQVGFAFGKAYADTPPERFDDAAERRQALAEINARLSPQARLVANMVVQTDETETLAKSYAEVGAALTTGRRKPSERTLMRHGQHAVNDTAKEIGAILQELAA
jgi:hypothetical protein